MNDVIRLAGSVMYNKGDLDSKDVSLTTPDGNTEIFKASRWLETGFSPESESSPSNSRSLSKDMYGQYNSPILALGGTVISDSIIALF